VKISMLGDRRHDRGNRHGSDERIGRAETFNPDGDDKCPSYADLRVTPPDTTDTVIVRRGISGACHFQVHPVGSDL
jgi:hypothetical protein